MVEQATASPPVAKAKEEFKESRLAIAKVLLPKVPSLLWHSASHCLSISETSKHWDLKTMLMVNMLRTVYAAPANPPHTIEKIQWLSMRPTKIEDTMIKHDLSYGVGTPEDGTSIEDAVRQAIFDLGAKGLEIDRVGVDQLTAEWLGYREKGANITEKGYKAVYSTTEADRTVLYLHGGGYYLMDPETHRPALVNLARTAKAKIFLIRYRLAPQSPLPAAIIDALISYLYLLYPPADAEHSAIPASKIVVSGDSAGGGLTFALLQLCYWFKRTGTTVLWHGKQVEVPLPAGCATLSPWVDVPRSFGSLGGRPNGSEDSCAKYDYIPVPSAAAKAVIAESAGWNSEMREKRGLTQFYAADRLMTNPLCSPLLAEEWGTDVPIWMNAGDECLRDAILYMAHRLNQAGVPLKFMKYSLMPHVFPGIIIDGTASQHSWDDMGRFVERVTGGTVAPSPNGCVFEYGSWKVHPQTFERAEFKEGELDQGLSFEEVKATLAKAVEEFRRLVHEGKDMEGASKL